MSLINKISIAMTTFRPLRHFPENGHHEQNETYLSGWMRSIERLALADEYLLIEKADKGEHQLKHQLHVPYRIIEAENDPPYADPFRQRMLNEAQNDWVLILDDDERLSDGMMVLIDSLATQDPVPNKSWVAICFPREDYIWHERLWRYVPANGLDHQMRLVNRHRVHWGDKPHSIPEVDGSILTVGSQANSILHYRSFQKIVEWTATCNEMFRDMPQIVKMQTDYVMRLRQMLGTK